MKKRILFLVLLAVAMTAVAQDKNRPGWLSNKPKPGNSTYFYVVERGSGVTIDEAISNAIVKVFRTTMMRIGATVTWTEVNNSLQNGADWGTVAMEYNIPVYKVCEYVERKTEDGYIVAVLCQVAKNGNSYPEFDDFMACTDTRSYKNGPAMLKSIFIPGWGQMSKRHYGSGVLTLIGEVALLSGAAGTYYMAQQDLATLQNNNITIADFNTAKNSYETWQTANLVCLSAAGVLYVFNIIRAGTMKPRYKNRDLSLAPVIMPMDEGLASGLNLTINF